MLAFGATPDVIEYAVTYTGITAFGFPFLILTSGGSALCVPTEARAIRWLAR